jgi:iron complex outermembrane receptor protein
MNRHKVIIGGAYRYSDDNLTGTPLASFTGIGEQTQVFSSFIQDKITLDPKTWFLTLGSKFEHNPYTGFEVEPDARLQWHPDEQDMVWTSVSRAVRTPSRIEEDLHIVQAVVGGGSLDTVANPGFEGEQLIAYEMGYRRQWTPEISTDISAFYNLYHGLSTTTFDGFIIGTNPIRLAEALAPVGNASAQTHGIETTLNWRPLETVNISASHSLLVMELSDTAAGTLGAKSADGQSPKYQANLHAAWDINKNLTYDAMLYYTSALTGFEIGSRTRLDMRLGWRIMDGLEFDLVGQDLLDSSHQEFSAPGFNPGVLASDIKRSVYGKLTWRF